MKLVVEYTNDAVPPENTIVVAVAEAAVAGAAQRN